MTCYLLLPPVALLFACGNDFWWTWFVLAGLVGVCAFIAKLTA